VSVLNRRFGHLVVAAAAVVVVVMTKMVLETSVQYRYLTRLMAREDFIEFSRRES
jgi:hypothetical protein